MSFANRKPLFRVITIRVNYTLLVLLHIFLSLDCNAQKKGRLYLSQWANRSSYNDSHEIATQDFILNQNGNPSFYDKYIEIFKTLNTNKESYPLNEVINEHFSDKLIPLGPKAHALRKSTYNKMGKNSKGLRIKLNSEEFIYKDGILWSTDTSSNLLKINLDRQAKSLRKTVKSLRILERKSPYASNIIRTLQNSENRFTISLLDITESYMLVPIQDGRLGVLNNSAYAFQAIERGSLLVDYAPFDQIGSGAEIRWNPKLGIISLAHELSHAFDANFGLMDDRLMQIYGEVISAREVRALFHENMIRKELKMKLKYKAKSGGALILNGMPYTYPLPVSARY